MSSKSSISVIFVAIVCSVLAWVVYVHIFSQEDVTGILVCSTVLSLCVWGNALFVGLILRDTIRRRGFWGINFRRRVCTQCGTSWSPWRIRGTRLTWRGIVRGIETCHECGFELNQWGRPVKDQNPLAKWNVLHTAYANQHKHRRRRRDDRILNVNDQTQRGDAL